jgi:hypothetical protein
MKARIIAEIIVLLTPSILFFGCVTTDIAYGYVLKNPKNRENSIDYIVEFDRGNDRGYDEMSIFISPVTEIKAGEKHIKLVNETYYKTIFTEPYSISISLRPYNNCTINELWLKTGDNKINLRDKTTAVGCTLGRPVSSQYTCLYTQEELEQFYIDGRLNSNQNQQDSKGYTIDIDNIDISYKKVRTFSIEINMSVEEYNGEQYDYTINVPFKRKKNAAREPYFIYWLFSKLFFNYN